MAIVRRMPETVRRPGQSVVQWAFDGGQRFERTTTHHKVTIGVGSRLFRFEFDRVQQGFSTSGPRHVAPGRASGTSRWSSMMLVGLLVLCLMLAFVKMLPEPNAATQYSAIMSIPKKSAIAAAVPPPPVQRLARPARVAPRDSRVNAPVSGLATEPAGATDLASFPEGEVTTITSAVDSDVEALPAGNGERAVAVWGLRREVNGKSCRDVQVFTRGVDGAISVKPSVKCDKGRAPMRE